LSFVGLVGLSSCGKKEAGQSIGAAPGTGQVRVVSVPSGLDIYLAKTSEVPEIFFGGEYHALVGGSLTQVGVLGNPDRFMPLFGRKYLKGATPAVLDLEPGEYWVGVAQSYPRDQLKDSPLEFASQMGEAAHWRANLGSNDFVLSDNNVGIIVDFKQVMTDSGRSGVGLATPSFETLGPDFIYGKYYRVQKQSGAAATLVALFQRPEDSPESLAAKYPAGQNFEFAEGDLRQALLQQGAIEDQLGGRLDLLRRGGKVILPGKSGSLVVEISSPNKWLITPIRWPEKE